MAGKKMRFTSIAAIARSAWVCILCALPAVADLCVLQGSFVTPSSTGNYTVSNLSCQPKLVIFSYTRSPDNATLGGANDNGFGAAVSSQSQFTIYAIDASSSSANLVRHNNAHVIQSSLPNGTSQVRAALTAINSDGFTLNFTNVDSSYAQIVRWMVLGGSDVEGVSIVRHQYDGSSPQVLTGAGFAPDAVLFATGGLASTPPAAATNTTYVYALGMAARVQGAQGAFGVSSNYTSAVRSRVQTQSVTDPDYRRALLAPADSSIAASAYVSAWGSDGVTLTWDVAPPDQWHFWAIYIKGPRFHMETFLNPSSTGSAQVTGAPFVPAAAIVGTYCNPSGSSVASSAYMAVGWAIDASNQGFRFSGRLTGSTGSGAAKYNTHVIGCYSVSSGGVVSQQVRGAFSQWISGSGNGNGMEISWTVTSTTQRQYLGLLIGAKPDGEPPPPPPTAEATQLGPRVVQGLIDMGGGAWIPPTATVATLPDASQAIHRVYLVTDSQSSGDCTVGGGTARTLCVSNGTNWQPL